jgi:uncharacterized protein (DUF1697 family)
MPRYAAFLRGMNLGSRRIANADLRRHVEALGFADVATFRASGNVIFDADGGEALDAIARRLEEGLEQALGYAVPAFARSARQLRAMAACEPFDAELVAAAKGKLQVSLLSAKPTATARARVLALATDDDRLALHGTELYWLPSGGILDTALDLGLIDELLGRCTRRTKGTIDLIAAKHFACST